VAPATCVHAAIVLHKPDICPGGQQQQPELLHMAKVMHGDPTLGTHIAPEQMYPDAQSAPLAQDVRHDCMLGAHA
jgi:hypothetical protein